MYYHPPETIVNEENFMVEKMQENNPEAKEIISKETLKSTNDEVFTGNIEKEELMKQLDQR